MNAVHPTRVPRDGGIAVVTVVLGGALVMLLAVTSIALVTTSVQNTSADRQSLTALAAAESGVADAVTYIREAGLSPFTCGADCADNDWVANSDASESCAAAYGGEPKGMTLTYGGDSAATVTIRLVNADTGAPQFRVCSVGESPGEGRRIVQHTFGAAALEFPFGVYGEEEVSLSGSYNLKSQSIFSNGPVYGRGHGDSLGIDPYYDMPAAVHSTEFITTTKKENDRIHYEGPCSETFPHDRDSEGGFCASPPPGSSTYFDDAMLEEIGGKLSNDELEVLRRYAEGDGLYFTDKNADIPPLGEKQHVVIFFDLNGETLMLQKNDVAGQQWDGECVSTPRTVVIVVRGGSLHYNSDAQMAGAMFVQDGTLTINGNPTWTGTMVADVVELTGNGTVQLTDCYLKNLPGSLLDISGGSFHEIDL